MYLSIHVYSLQGSCIPNWAPSTGTMFSGAWARVWSYTPRPYSPLRTTLPESFSHGGNTWLVWDPRTLVLSQQWWWEKNWLMSWLLLSYREHGENIMYELILTYKLVIWLKNCRISRFSNFIKTWLTFMVGAVPHLCFDALIQRR